MNKLNEDNNIIYRDLKQGDLLILGAGGHGHVVLDIARKNGYKNIYFLDDIIPRTFNNHNCLKIIGRIKELDLILTHCGDCDFFVAVGDNDYRKKIMKTLKNKNKNIPTLIHPSAVIDSSALIGNGTIILANVVVNAKSKIGEGCILNTSSTIDHDCLISDYVHISPGVHVAGNVTIGSNSWIGIGSIIINNIKIQENVIIGAGTTVISNVNQAGKYVGLPLKKIG